MYRFQQYWSGRAATGFDHGSDPSAPRPITGLWSNSEYGNSLSYLSHVPERIKQRKRESKRKKSNTGYVQRENFLASDSATDSVTRRALYHRLPRQTHRQYHHHKYRFRSNPCSCSESCVRGGFGTACECSGCQSRPDKRCRPLRNSTDAVH